MAMNDTAAWLHPDLSRRETGRRRGLPARSRTVLRGAAGQHRTGPTDNGPAFARRPSGPAPGTWASRRNSPAPIAPRPTARPNASCSRRCRSGPADAPTRPPNNAVPPCPRGCILQLASPPHHGIDFFTPHRPSLNTSKQPLATSRLGTSHLGHFTNHCSASSLPPSTEKQQLPGQLNACSHKLSNN